MNAPVLTSLAGVFGATWADRWDINGTFTFDHGGFAPSDMEIWLRREFVDADFALWGTFNSAAAGFTVDHLSAASVDPIHYQVKLRFNNHVDPPGPFSNVFDVVMPEPAAPAGFALVKEAGAGLTNANSYASVADGDDYHDGHLYATAWTGATLEKKTAALVMASRLIDAEYQFGGVRAVASQALQWPREDCPDPDAGDVVAKTMVPKAVVEAACELARELIITDRTAAPPGEGLSYQNVGSNQTGYNKSDTRPIIPAVVQALLGKFGSLIKSKSGSVKLVRV